MSKYHYHFNNSGTIDSCEYDDNVEILSITFKTYNIYKYKDVPIEEYRAFTSAESPGNYFASNIRNKYEVEKE